MLSLSISLSMEILNFFMTTVYTCLENLTREKRYAPEISRYFRVFTRGSRADALKREASARTCHTHKYTVA